MPLSALGRKFTRKGEMLIFGRRIPYSEKIAVTESVSDVISCPGRLLAYILANLREICENSICRHQITFQYLIDSNQ
jgi:hypothetical protein